jgi:hypothetical protein
MNPRVIAFAFLVGCSTTLALGQQNVQQIPGVNSMNAQVVDQEWLTKQSKDLLDIIRILYAGRDAELKELESGQADMKSRDQIERRIALIKVTLSEKETK